LVLQDIGTVQTGEEHGAAQSRHRAESPMLFTMTVDVEVT
jgi:hypothetical protein